MLRTVTFALLALLTSAAPTSPYHPLRAIALSKVQEHQEPICCLKPLPPLESVQDQVFLSFEQWKAKQLATLTDQHGKAVDAAAAGNNPTSPTENTTNSNSKSTSPPPSSQSDSSSEVNPNTPRNEMMMRSGHFTVPLTDRFNYASLDCSARVHTSHRSAKSPAAILSSKRDRYMLSPCRSSGTREGEGGRYVVVELCEDISIDTVQLANFEFFSGVFKDFTVSVAKTYTGTWTLAGSYTAKNVRVVQSFHPPPSLRDFYRYIRIDFKTHYGNEYYCPVSLLRVYGLTHLEHWKWDLWESESKDRRDTLAEAEATSVAVENVPPEETVSPSGTKTNETEVVVPKTTTDSPSTSSSSSSSSSSGVSSVVGTDTSTTQTPPVATNTSEEPAKPTNTPLPPDTHSSPSPADPSTPTSSSPLSHTNTNTHTNNNTTTPDQPTPSPTTTTSSISTIITAISTPSTPANNGGGGSGGGESIYRIIMNRLTALETNHTLYARYVDEQTAGIREVMRRLGEDVGRLEGIGKAQAQNHQRALHEWESHRRKRDSEHEELMFRVKYLADEVALEKRLGIAQLCVLATVLIFMAVTRGSRASHGHGDGEHGKRGRFNSSMREWGRRHLSFSGVGGWAGRLRGVSDVGVGKGEVGKGMVGKMGSSDLKYEFPTKKEEHSTSPSPSPSPIRLSDRAARPPRLNLSLLNNLSNNNNNRARTRSRTPSNLSRRPVTNASVSVSSSASASASSPLSQDHRTHKHNPNQNYNRQYRDRATTPGVGWPTSSSMSFVVGPPRSARQWARSAHLHPVRGARGSAGARKTSGEGGDAVGFGGVPTPTPTVGDEYGFGDGDGDGGGDAGKVTETETGGNGDGEVGKEREEVVLVQEDGWLDTDMESESEGDGREKGGDEPL